MSLSTCTGKYISLSSVVNVISLSVAVGEMTSAAVFQDIIQLIIVPLDLDDPTFNSGEVEHAVNQSSESIDLIIDKPVEFL